MSHSFLFKRFSENRNGSVIVIFALVATVLLGAIGAAIDFAKAFSARTKMQAASDAAALAAAADPYEVDDKAKTVASNFFDASKTRIIRDVDPKYSIEREYNITAVDVTVTSTAKIDTTLLRFAGIKTLEVSAAATASRPMNVLDIYAVIDMSASMGIAADDANRKRLLELTRSYTANGKGCAFGCHQAEANVKAPVPLYEIAKQNNVRLREDVMKDAFASFVDDIMNSQDETVKNGQRRIATYGFSDALTRLAPLSKNASDIKNSLTLFPDKKRLRTRFRDVMTSVSREVGTSGNGTLSKPKKMVLLVTDGVGWPIWPIGGYGSPLDPHLCRSLKRDGVEVAVLEVKYFEDVSDTEFFVPQISRFYPKISPSLKECASPGLYFKVEDSADAQLRVAFKDVARAMKPKLSLVK